MTMNTSRMIELALVFFVSLLSFSIGTFVGKKYSDNQHRLAKLEPQKQTHEEHDMGQVVDTTETEPSAKKESTISDSDVAKLAAEFEGEEDHDTHGEKNVKEIPNEAAGSKTANALKKIQDNTSENAKETVRDVASISEKAKSIGGNYHYTVQVGAYPTSGDADKVTATLKARGYKAQFAPAEVNGKLWYRVQVGQFTNLEEAQKHKQELMEENRLTSAIIQKVQN